MTTSEPQSIPGVLRIGNAAQPRAAHLYRDGQVSYTSSRARRTLPAGTTSTFIPGGWVYYEILDKAHAEALQENQTKPGR